MRLCEPHSSSSVLKTSLFYQQRRHLAQKLPPGRKVATLLNSPIWQSVKAGWQPYTGKSAVPFRSRSVLKELASS